MPDPTGYGRVIRDEKGQVVKIVEQKDGTPEELAVDEVNAGIYCFDMSLLWDMLHNVTNDNARGEYYLTDIIGMLVSAVQNSQCLCCAVLCGNTRCKLASADGRSRTGPAPA